eukprot:CAMPEP_0172444050 /NCGR_PEP_ID=MMETSP1065-20121228/4185_1 /TAXON_ID=265537 /ORGANISM="Amphiprora paludosa, Strain CCMP125" /LENGTH=62 /DNA_ID=CAMNT_0013194467 /DNA_START=163 /DNA_END=351 /DNA_ORIENTATION=-
MGVVVIGSISSIAYSHYAQVRDRMTMKEGVERDKERVRQMRKEQKRKQRLLAENEEQDNNSL